MFPNLYSDLIVLWEQGHGDGSIWAQTLYFRGGGIMGMGAFWRERGDRSNFFKDLFSKNLFHYMIHNNHGVSLKFSKYYCQHSHGSSPL